MMRSVGFRLSELWILNKCVSILTNWLNYRTNLRLERTKRRSNEILKLTVELLIISDKSAFNLIKSILNITNTTQILQYTKLITYHTIKMVCRIYSLYFYLSSFIFWKCRWTKYIQNHLLMMLSCLLDLK